MARCSDVDDIPAPIIRTFLPFPTSRGSLFEPGFSMVCSAETILLQTNWVDLCVEKRQQLSFIYLTFSPPAKSSGLGSEGLYERACAFAHIYASFYCSLVISHCLESTKSSGALASVTRDKIRCRQGTPNIEAIGGVDFLVISIDTGSCVKPECCTGTHLVALMAIVYVLCTFG